MAAITSLFVFPVKSLGGIAVSESLVAKRGLEHDRRWMIVDADGVFMTQRSDTRLALFRTAISPEGLHLTNPCGETMIANFKPLGKQRSVRVWKDTCDAVQVSAEIDAWLSNSLEQPCGLVYMPEGSHRATSATYTQAGDIVGFADAFQILVIGDSSLDELNSRLDLPLPINRFRPNITVMGWAPHQEDDWSELQIGDVVLRAAKKCGRCSVTATDQQTGVVGVEPLRTLAGYRLEGQAIQFGAYFVPACTGTIRVGDEIAFR
jgi:uncharacterized protein YcbX